MITNIAFQSKEKKLILVTSVDLFLWQTLNILLNTYLYWIIDSTEHEFYQLQTSPIHS